MKLYPQSTTFCEKDNFAEMYQICRLLGRSGKKRELSVAWKTRHGRMQIKTISCEIP